MATINDTDITLTVGLDPKSVNDGLKDIEKSLTDMEKRIQQLSGKASSSVDNGPRVEWIDTTAEEVTALEIKLREACDEVKELRARLNELNSQRAGSDSLNAANASIQQLQNNLDANNQRLQEADNQIQQLNASLNQTSSQASQEIQRLAARVAQLEAALRNSNQEQEHTHTNVTRTTQVFGKLAGLFRQIPGNLKNINRGVNRAIASVKRLALNIVGLALGVRGIMAIVNKMRSAFTAGFKDIYNQDKKFKTQMDTLKQKILDIQVALAKALMPVIQMVIPYIKQILDWILQLIQGLSTFISTITGIKAYTKAIKGLGGAAQNTAKQLSKFDELNNLSTGGGGGLTPDNASIPDPKKIEDLFEFTRGIVEKIKKILQDIPWDEIKEKARKFGSNIAKIINGAMDPEFWGVLGTTIAQGLNTALEFLYTLGDEIEWEDVGASLAEFIGHMLDDFDWKLLADTIDVWVQGLWTAITTAFTHKDEKGETLGDKLVNAIKEFTSNLDVGTIKILSSALLLVGGASLAATLGKSVAGMLASSIAENLAKKFAEGTLFSGLAGAGGIVGGSAGVSMGTQATTAIGTVGGASVLGSLGAALATFTGIYTLVNGLGQSLAMILPGGEFMGLSEDEWAAANPLYKIFDKDKFDGFFEDFFDNIGLDKAIINLEDRFQTAFSSVGGYLAVLVGHPEKADEINTKLQEILSWYNNFANNIGFKTGEMVTKIELKIREMKDNFKQRAEEIKSAFFTKVEDIKIKLTTFWQTYLKSWFSKKKWDDLLKSIPEAFEGAIKTAKNLFIAGLNAIIAAVEKFINEGFFSGVNKLIAGANAILPGDKQINPLSGNITLPRIPALAQGAVIPPGMSDFIARLGDNNNETEIVSPLSTMKQALLEALQESGGTGEIHVHVDLDGKEIAKAVVRQNDMFKKSTGRTMFA